MVCYHVSYAGQWVGDGGGTWRWWVKGKGKAEGIRLSAEEAARDIEEIQGLHSYT